MFAVSLGCIFYLMHQPKGPGSNYERQSAVTSNPQRKTPDNNQLISGERDDELLLLINRLKEQNPDLNRQQIIALTGRIADPEKRLNLIASLPDEYRIWALGADFDELVRKNPKICAAWLHNFEPGKDIQRSMAVKIFSELCVSDFSRSLNSLSDLTPEQRAPILRNGLFRWLQDMNPETAISEFRKRFSGEDYNAAVRSVCIATVNKDPLLLYNLARDPKNGVPPELLSGIYQSLIKSGDVEYLVKDFRSLDSKTLQSVLENRENMAVLMVKAPQETMQILSTLQVSQNNIGIFEAAAAKLAEGNPVKAIEWIKSLEASQQKSGLITTVYEKWAALDLEAAEVAAKSSPGEVRNGAMKGIGGLMGKTKLEDGIAMVPQFDGSDREAYFTGLVKGAVKTGPETLIKLLTDDRVSSSLVDSTNTWDQFNEAVSQIAATDQIKALNYFNSFGEENKSKTIDGLIRGWSKSDPIAASNWLMQQRDGEMRNLGIRSMIEIVGKADPDAARQWQALINN